MSAPQAGERSLAEVSRIIDGMEGWEMGYGAALELAKVGGYVSALRRELLALAATPDMPYGQAVHLRRIAGSE